MVYAATMNGFNEYSTELDYAKIDLRKEYNEAMIEAFLVLISQNDNSALRAELYRLVNIDK